MTAPYASCRLCPRRCAVDRSQGETGFCAQGTAPKLAWSGLHFGEEPPVTGQAGSGTVFFSGCTLGCPFCQNRQISHDALGRSVSVGRLAKIIHSLEKAGAENINLVTGTQFTPGIVAALTTARTRGFALPVLWNSSGYECPQTLAMLRSVVDVYLPDCKTLDPELSQNLFGVADYPDFAQQAITQMVADKPLKITDEQDQPLRIKQGVIVRHLVLPGYPESTRQVLSWFSRTLKEKALLSLMFQYTPIIAASSPLIPDRQINRSEYDQVMGWLTEYEINEGYVQELSGKTDWLPDFSKVDPFTRGRTVWSASSRADNRA